MSTQPNYRFRGALALLSLFVGLGTLAEARSSEPTAKPQRPILSALFQRGARAQPEPREARRGLSRGDAGVAAQPQARRSAAQGPRSSRTNRTSRTSRTERTDATSGIRVNRFVLARSNVATNRVVIDIAKQRAYLLVDGAVAIEAPISSARPGKRTPRGRFSVTERVRSGKISTIYGVSMPYWMRLNNTVFGLHAGHLPGYPASAGCVRLHPNGAPLIFDHTRRGTRVDIYSSWSGS